MIGRLAPVVMWLVTILMVALVLAHISQRIALDDRDICRSRELMIHARIEWLDDRINVESKFRHDRAVGHAASAVSIVDRAYETRLEQLEKAEQCIDGALPR